MVQVPKTSGERVVCLSSPHNLGESSWLAQQEQDLHEEEHEELSCGGARGGALRLANKFSSALPF